MMATLRLAWASSKQLLRSREVLFSMVVYPGLFLVLLVLFSRLQLETSQGATSLMDVWLTGAALLVVALGNGHAFLALIATYKSTGVLKRIAVMPVSPAQLIVGEVIPRAVMGMVAAVAFLALGRALGADIRLGPDLLAVVPLVAIVVVTGLSVSFVIAGLTKSPQDANALEGYLNFPLYLFTGAMWPLAAFPDWLQQVARVIPYTGLIAAIRGVALDGQPLTAFGPELAIAAAWLALLFVAASRAYRFVQ
ncbi:MAG: ABC transporter permease [Ardenticatenaceae bacterium]|nr:ABC transporter permease [Ardenticatenaceae bacterium]